MQILTLKWIECVLHFSLMKRRSSWFVLSAFPSAKSLLFSNYLTISCRALAGSERLLWAFWGVRSAWLFPTVLLLISFLTSFPSTEMDFLVGELLFPPFLRDSIFRGNEIVCLILFLLVFCPQVASRLWKCSVLPLQQLFCQLLERNNHCYGWSWILWAQRPPKMACTHAFSLFIYLSL